MTLLGQNVNSFRDTSEVQFNNAVSTNLSRGFSTNYKAKQGGLRFAYLLDQVSRIDPEMRIRFTSPHPKDFPDEVSIESLVCRTDISILIIEITGDWESRCSSGADGITSSLDAQGAWPCPGSPELTQW